MLGIALVDKPSGMSSHDAIYMARRSLGIRKIGHAGTLDPNATGLLVMAVGDATRFLPYLQTDPKTYEGVALLGVTTTTQDSEGEVVEKRSVEITLQDINTAAERFLGEIEQIPPMFSAVKVAGERLYKSARRGEDVDRKSRNVFVSELQFLDFTDDHLRFRVKCSAGTYVRTLLHDLGAALGCGAYLTALRRTSSGAFSVHAAVPPETLREEHVLTLEDALSCLPMVRLPADQIERAKHGNDFPYAAQVSGDQLCLLDDRGVFAVAVRLNNDRWQPERVLPLPQ